MSLLGVDRVREVLSSLGETPGLEVPEEWVPMMRPIHAEAAVLLALTERDGALSLLYTRRAATLRNHSGEMSFPGGRRDPEDADLLETALREAHEEVALAPADVTVFGALMRMPTVTGFDLTSYVGEFAQPYALTHNPGEIDYMLEVPLERLAAPGVHQVAERTFDGRTFPVHTFEHGLSDQPIWGATGVMTWYLLRLLGVELAERP